MILDAVVVVDVETIELSHNLILHQEVTADLADLQISFTVLAHPLANNHLLAAVRVIDVTAVKLCHNLIRKQLVMADSASHNVLRRSVKSTPWRRPQLWR